MNNIIEKIYRIGIVPVVIINNSENAIPLVKALIRGGIPTAEITFRTVAAKESISKITKKMPNFLVGAGTITNVDMAKQAIEAGAKYIVSPGLNKKVVEYCLEHNIAVIPGVATPTEIEAAMDIGIYTLKFFPAEQIGGSNMLLSLSSPYSQIKFIPTGGINCKNLNQYLDLPNVLACGGSWMCPAALIDTQKFNEIEDLCRQAVLKMHGFSLLHIGLNSADENEAKTNADLFSDMLSLSVTDNPTALFVGNIMEVVKCPFLGTHGHIAISTNNVDRAITYFESRGYTFRKEGLAKDSKGIIAIYFENEVGGFAIHLRRK